MGISTGEGSQIGADLFSYSKKGARSTSSECSEGGAAVGGNLQAITKGCGNSSSCTPTAWLHVKNVSHSKEGWTMRPIIDLRELNKFIHWEHFKMEGIHLIQMLLQEGNWMMKLDLKDAYFAVPIHHTHRRYLMFQFRGITYQFECLPFGLTSAPRVFTKIMSPITAWLTQLGCRMISYVDNNLILATSRQEAKMWGKLSIALLEGLGFTVNYEKYSLDPAQRTVFLGFMINSMEMSISVPTGKLTGIQTSAKALAQQSAVSVRALAKFIGTATSMKLAIPPAPLFYRALQAAKNAIDLQVQSIDSSVQLGSVIVEASCLGKVSLCFVDCSCCNC